MINGENKSFLFIILLVAAVALFCCCNNDDSKIKKKKSVEKFVNNLSSSDKLIDVSTSQTKPDNQSLLATTVNNKIVNDALNQNDLINSVMSTNDQQTKGASVNTIDNLIIQDSNKEYNNEPMGIITRGMQAGLDDTILNVDFGSILNDKQPLSSHDLLPSKDVNDFSMYNIGTTYMDANLGVNSSRKLGIDTIGNSKKNASHDIRGTIPCPKFVVSPWNNSTYEPDTNIRQM
jgi:hypothetical protein